MDAEIQKIRSLLLRKRDEITANLANELGDLESPAQHLADLEEMSDVRDMEAVFGIFEVGSGTLEQIDRALARIENGTYGVCEDCGERIHTERLQALPFATQCVDCKRKAERQLG